MNQICSSTAFMSSSLLYMLSWIEASPPCEYPLQDTPHCRLSRATWLLQLLVPQQMTASSHQQWKLSLQLKLRTWQDHYIGPRAYRLGPRSCLLGPRSCLLGPGACLLGPRACLLGPRPCLLGLLSRIWHKVRQLHLQKTCI